MKNDLINHPNRSQVRVTQQETTYTKRLLSELQHVHAQPAIIFKCFMYGLVNVYIAFVVVEIMKIPDLQQQHEVKENKKQKIKINK